MNESNSPAQEDARLRSQAVNQIVPRVKGKSIFGRKISNPGNEALDRETSSDQVITVVISRNRYQDNRDEILDSLNKLSFCAVSTSLKNDPNNSEIGRASCRERV